MDRGEVIKRLCELAFGKANDVAKLALLESDKQQYGIDNLDLSLLSELKINSNGSVEVKLLNRLTAIEMLLREFGADAAISRSAEGESFLEALKIAAAEAGGEK